MPFFSRSSLSRSQKARRRDAADEIPTLSFEVDSVDFIPAGDEVGLLRLSGFWVAPVDRVLDAVSLVATVGGHPVEVTPLPDPEGTTPLATPAGEPWRAAFSMSCELAQNATTEFALAVRDGERIELPRPGELQAAGDSGDEHDADAAVPAVAADHEVALDETDGDELAWLRTEVSRLHTELEIERRRHASLEEELRGHAVLENDLRNAMAMQEAEMAAAVTQAAQHARREERQRERKTSVEAGNRPARPLDAELIDRLERARRAADAAA